ncbi:MBL fold metallo-hydrolase [bacterium]|nr:MBL fold metallo-hydrolase [bacterium]
MSEDLTAPIDWLGHASFRLRGSKVVYIDPWKIDGEPHDGDLVLMTHHHYDHLSPEDIKRAAKPDALLVMPEVAAKKYGLPVGRVFAAGDSLELDGVKVEAVRAYNINKKFHPADDGGLGYIVELDGTRIYHAGDTDVIDEMEQVRCDIALLPVGGTYTMTAEEAVAAVRKINPRVVVPMHWGDIVGERGDAEYIRDNVPCQVVIKEPVT